MVKKNLVIRPVGQLSCEFFPVDAFFVDITMHANLTGPPAEIIAAGRLTGGIIGGEGILAGNLITVTVFNNSGTLALYIPYQDGWRSFRLRISVANAGTKANRITSATNTAKPGTIDKESYITDWCNKIWHSGNLGNATEFQHGLALLAQTEIQQRRKWSKVMTPGLAIQGLRQTNLSLIQNWQQT